MANGDEKDAASPAARGDGGTVPDPDVDGAERSALVEGEDLQAAVAKLEAEKADLQDRLLRALAETENVRRRAGRELNDMRDYAVTKFARDMIGVADNLERASASVTEHAADAGEHLKTLLHGIVLTGKEMQTALERHGVKKLVPLGERFDPNFHEAMFEVADPQLPAHTVAQVVQPGYTIGERALRPAKVGIVKRGEEPDIR